MTTTELFHHQPRSFLLCFFKLLFISNMVSQKDVQGRVYKFKGTSECFGLDTDVLVLVLGLAPRRLNHVKVMTNTSTRSDSGDYIPISPTPKKGFPIQLRLRNYREWYRDAPRIVPMLPKYSYLKIDSDYEIPLQMLVEERDCLGNPLMVWPKHQGGLGELRSLNVAN
ncbi:hypothetical protein BJ875DRAFT_465023 [Amylocarpus encephaloides]|uniref:Uncharacterized protein n=1 Tax=Amylocarpus encephaloides TaxID=45428 RepID=A0A9P7YGC8_9HELO|nr:hypothetical protein BJ875DRAFT_465023 [Amylocarpus encephaloides]